MRYMLLTVAALLLGCSNPTAVDTIGSYHQELEEAIAANFASENPSNTVCFKYSSGRVSPPYYETCVRLFITTLGPAADKGDNQNAFPDCDPSTIRCWSEWHPALNRWVFRCDMGDCSISVLGDE